MNIINDKRKSRLLEEIKNREYRDEFVSSNIDVGVAFQIRALRKQRELTQQQLADKAGMLQERISALENPDRAPSISTLKKLATALDIGLIVRFVSIGELLDWHFDLSSESLNVPSFDEDPYFNAQAEYPNTWSIAKNPNVIRPPQDFWGKGKITQEELPRDEWMQKRIEEPSEGLNVGGAVL